MTLMLTFDLDLDMEQGHIQDLGAWYLGQRLTIVMTYFDYKVEVKGQDLGHYPAKLLERFRFAQNVFNFYNLSIKAEHNGFSSTLR